MPKIEPKPDHHSKVEQVSQDKNVHVYRVIIGNKKYKVKVLNKRALDPTTQDVNTIFHAILKDLTKENGFFEAISGKKVTAKIKHKKVEAVKITGLKKEEEESSKWKETSDRLKKIFNVHLFSEAKPKPSPSKDDSVDPGFERPDSATQLRDNDQARSASQLNAPPPKKRSLSREDSFEEPIFEYRVTSPQILYYAFQFPYWKNREKILEAENEQEAKTLADEVKGDKLEKEQLDKWNAVDKKLKVYIYLVRLLRKCKQSTLETWLHSAKIDQLDDHEAEAANYVMSLDKRAILDSYRLEKFVLEYFEKNVKNLLQEYYDSIGERLS
ncbi:MAG: hypothetical protein WD595_00360 [Waddliaceae bacterium]